MQDTVGRLRSQVEDLRQVFRGYGADDGAEIEPEYRALAASRRKGS